MTKQVKRFDCPEDRIILAADFCSYAEATPLISMAKHFKIWGVKFPQSICDTETLGSRSLIYVMSRTRRRGIRHISYDAKLSEEPHQMSKVLERLSGLPRPPDMLTVTVSDTTDMDSLNVAVNLGKNISVIGYTVSSTLTQENIAGKVPIGEKVRQLGVIAAEAGLDGITVPQKWLADLNKEASTKKLLKVVSGVTSPADALANGADFLIAGRMVTQGRRTEHVLEQFIEAAA